MSSEDTKVEFSAKVSKEAYDEFKETFPQYGAVNWFINSALESLNAKVKESPEFKDIVNSAISDLLEKNRNRTYSAS
jgi:hypothetical protein